MGGFRGAVGAALVAGVTFIWAGPASAAAARPPGYRLVAADGGVFSFGDAPFYGSLGGRQLSAPIVAGDTTPDGGGYWMLGQDGGVFTFGDAPFEGAVNPAAVGLDGGDDSYQVVDRSGAVEGLGGSRIPLIGSALTIAPGPGGVAAPFVGIAGDWTATAEGGVFTLRNAPFFGSLGGLQLKAPIVGIAATPTGKGYWLVASDGGVFAFGDAGFFGSTGALVLNKPVVGMAPTSSGDGYWLVASDGGVFAFGDAPFLGSTGGMALNQPIVALLPA